MEYREIYKALERRWRSTPGVRFMDFSGWRQPRGADGRARLLLLIEDQATMQRVCITHAGGWVVISCAPISGRLHQPPPAVRPDRLTTGGSKSVWRAARLVFCRGVCLTLIAASAIRQGTLSPAVDAGESAPVQPARESS